MTDNDSDSTPTDEQIETLENGYGIDRHTLVNALAKHLRISFTLENPQSRQDRLSLLTTTFEAVWGRNAKQPLIPEALDEALWPAASTTLEAHRRQLCWKTPENIPDRIYQSTANEFFRAAIYHYWENYCEGLDTAAGIDIQ